jgi:hypothetical protein
VIQGLSPGVRAPRSAPVRLPIPAVRRCRTNIGGFLPSSSMHQLSGGDGGGSLNCQRSQSACQGGSACCHGALQGVSDSVALRISIVVGSNDDSSRWPGTSRNGTARGMDGCRCRHHPAAGNAGTEPRASAAWSAFLPLHPGTDLLNRRSPQIHRAAPFGVRVNRGRVGCSRVEGGTQCLIWEKQPPACLRAMQ